MTKQIRNLLILFVVMSIAGIGYIAFRYVGADSLIGLGPYVVKVEMTDSGGIFPKASVSYRGVEIGKVGDMRVTPTGLETDLEIEEDSPDVPASAIAVIAN
ncbi:MAG: phospholipid/cholesterol/gamma-HCH transport system substrate-binding protein, partial [Microbacteriaceae bacterium]|nr:phospholipid/cholesterol/gamma-HCH transport system substrate-binding protein [Microbacteriaceae bacterium]